MSRTSISGPFEIRIEKLVYGGEGFGRHQGKVVFVPLSVPGDELLVQPVEEKKTFIRAEIVRVLDPGSGRTQPACSHFGKCGGCHWQQLEYSRQVEAKRQILEELFHHRFPQTRNLEIPMQACLHPFAYRSRARVQMRGSGPAGAVGFFRRGSHLVEDVESCPLFRPSLNEALGSLRKSGWKDSPDSALREVEMACSEEDGSWIASSAGSEMKGSAKPGEVLLRRKVGAFAYSTDASVFFQANDFMVQDLVACVMESAREAGSESALDLYAGVGLFTLPLAGIFRKVIAVENSQAACRLCAANASAAGRDNIRVVCSDVPAWAGAEQSPRTSDLIVLDPPRTGADQRLMEKIGEWGSGTVIYVSCDPQTLCRDLAKISPSAYRIDLVWGFDMFPQTYHFETIVRLIRN